MLVVKVYLWPQGNHRQERLLSVMRIFNVGTTPREDAPEITDRVYVVQILKDATHIPGGAERLAGPLPPRPREIWRSARIGGHVVGRPGPAARGVWDLVGGALKVILGRRLAPYRDENGEG